MTTISFCNSVITARKDEVHTYRCTRTVRRFSISPISMTHSWQHGRNADPFLPLIPQAGHSGAKGSAILGV